MANTTLKTYRAPTIGEALSQVKKELGKDAVILHTRSYKVGSFMGFFGKPMVEITASVGVNVVNPLDLRRAGRAASAAAAGGTESRTSARGNGSTRGGGGGPALPSVPTVLQRAYGVARTTSANVANTTERASSQSSAQSQNQFQGQRSTSVQAAESGNRTKPRTGTSAATSRLDQDTGMLAVEEANVVGSAGMSADLQEELTAIKCMVAQVLQSSARGAAAGGASVPSPAMPEALLKFYLRLIQNDVSREIADEVTGAIRDELTPHEMTDEGIVRQSVLRHLETLIPTDATVSAPARGPDGRPHTIALVGPTGVGKTTTVAKLAAAYRLRHGKKVALVTSDTYRIAAVDQLRTYATIIGVPLHVAHTPEQMAECLEACHDCDVVLIDTAGRSPGDSPRLEELRAFLAAANPHQVHLVLASVASEGALLRTASQFAIVEPTRVIFTKLDEAASFGVLVNVAKRLNARLSFVTTGQEVPDDIEPGRADRLARMILDGSIAA